MSLGLTNFIMRLPCDRRRRWPPCTTQRVSSCNLGGRIVSGFFAHANMSQFAYVSPICGTNKQFKSLIFKHCATRNRRGKPSIRTRQVENVLQLTDRELRHV